MTYRDAAGFFCTAEKLLELINSITALSFTKKEIEWVLALIDSVYGDESLEEMVERTLRYNSVSRYNIPVKAILEFGRENGISRESWLEAIEKFPRTA